ncbi:MAG TPA: alpha/beta fold hydrolase [Vicinamibacterales bacterium]|nr:alpha/beta fold hydrolase [Vicinamibacterales bacterium]
MVERFFHSNGLRLRYLDGGDGDTIVLVHGFAQDADRWVKTGTFARLAARYRVLALDCRGHGRSDKPHDPTQYGDMDADVVHMLDDAAVRRAHFVGYSMGGALVGRMLVRHHEYVVTATLVGATGLASTTGAANRARMADEFERGEAHSLVLAVRPTNEGAPDDAQVREASAKVLAGNDPLALAALLRAPIVPIVAADLAVASETAAMLGVAGTADPALHALLELKKTVPRLHVVAIEGAGHAATLSRPELVDAIEQFLSSSVRHW